jgi:cell shape-determining protein MreC
LVEKLKEENQRLKDLFETKNRELEFSLSQSAIAVKSPLPNEGVRIA